MINNFYSNALGLLLVILGASIWERFNDRNGDLNKREDVFYRAALVLLASVLHTLFNAPNCEDVRRTLIFLVLTLNLAVASFFMIFDYWITYTLLKNRTIELPRDSVDTWFTYKLGGGLSFWKKASPRTRLFIRIGYFALALTIYFIWRS